MNDHSRYHKQRRIQDSEKEEVTAPAIQHMILLNFSKKNHIKSKTFFSVQCILKMKILKDSSLILLHCTITDPGCTAYINCEVYKQEEMAAPPGQFIALQAINVLE